MRNLSILVLLICLMGTYSPTGVSGRIIPEEKTIQGAIAVDEQINKAILDSDTGAFKRLLADDFTYINSSGKLLDKDKYIEEIKYSGVKYESVTPREMKARIYGDTVVLTGRLFASWRNQNQDNTGRYRYTRVYVWKQDHWLLTASQTTSMNE